MLTCSRGVWVPASSAARMCDGHLAAVGIIQKSHKYGVHVSGRGELFDIPDALF